MNTQSPCGALAPRLDVGAGGAAGAEPSAGCSFSMRNQPRSDRSIIIAPMSCESTDPSTTVPAIAALTPCGGWNCTAGSPDHSFAPLTRRTSPTPSAGRMPGVTPTYS